jgi:hypothetical protein
MREVFLKFLDLYADSVITQSLLALGVVGGWLYMLTAQIPVPQEFYIIVGTVIGYFFGSKTAIEGRKARKSMMEDIEKARANAPSSETYLP